MAGRHAIVGLGNPGPRYEGTRHNVGFEVVDALGGKLSALVTREAHGALWARVESEVLGEIFLAKPQTFMNRSGEPLVGLLDDWQLGPGDVLVVHDDVDLEAGRLKLKRGGGTGGHRGLESIEQEAGTRDFCRLRFGVGRPTDGQDTADYVLEQLGPEERKPLEESVPRARDGALDWLRLDFEAAMKNVNTRPKKPVAPGESGC